MLSYANSMLNPLLYAAFNENFRVGFARACRCLGRGGAAAAAATGRVGGQSSTGRAAATDNNRLRPADDRQSVAGRRIEVVDVVVSGRTAVTTLDDVAAPEDVKLTRGGGVEFDATVVPSCPKHSLVNTAEQPVDETRM